jgi:broad specificity phosphatase PhoE
MPAKVILCRHGATDFNAGPGVSSDREDKIRGWLNVPLDARGREQAQELADKLAGVPVDVLVSSPLGRAKETAETIAEAQGPGCEVETDRGLMPWNVGDFAGQPTKTVLPKMRALVKKGGEAPPGGEPFDDFRARGLRTVASLLQEAKQIGGVVCAVTHTRNIQLVKAWVAAGKPKDYSVDDAVMDDYSNETGTGDTLEVTP